MYVKDIGSEPDKISGLNKIIWYYKASTSTSYLNKQTTYTGQTTIQHVGIDISGLSAGMKYDMYAVIYDAAGNTTTSNTITVETYIELRNANSTIKSTYNFYGSVTPSAPAFGNEYINLQNYSGLSSGMIVYASSEASYGGTSITKVGYYQLKANYTNTSSSLTYIWSFAYLGTSCPVTSDTRPTELKEDSTSKKTLYNFYGEVKQGSPGYGISLINLGGYSDLNVGMIVYASNVGTYGNYSIPIGYYCLTYSDEHTGFWHYQYLGTTFKVY